MNSTEENYNGIFHFLFHRDDFKVPEQMAEPPKLFRVQRFAPLRHRNYWERRIISDLGLLNNVSHSHNITLRLDGVFDIPLFL